MPLRRGRGRGGTVRRVAGMAQSHIAWQNPRRIVEHERHMTNHRTYRHERLEVRIGRLLGVAVATAAMACANGKSPQPTQASQGTPREPTLSPQSAGAPQAEQVLLEGTFERVARASSGKAQIVRRGTRYELCLKDMTVAQEGTLRVYLVGHPRASNTRVLDETEMKYDMAELERNVAEQRIELPSEPDPALRSVVIYNPLFGVNVAFASLQPPANAP